MHILSFSGQGWKHQVRDEQRFRRRYSVRAIRGGPRFGAAQALHHDPERASGVQATRSRKQGGFNPNPNPNPHPLNAFFF